MHATRVMYQHQQSKLPLPIDLDFFFYTFAGYSTVKILKFGTPQTIAIIVLKIEKFDVTLY